VVDHWITVAQDAQERGDWDLAISTVEPNTDCYSTDHERHNAHLWHMDLLAKAGHLDALVALSHTDVHARRRLDRHLYETGQEAFLAQRAQAGDAYAGILLDRLALERSGDH
jgi:hypothetical protein